MPAKVVELASEAVASCSICRKYSRLPARLRSKVSLAVHIEDKVELDVFYLWSKTFVLMVDVATHYKVAYETTSREASDIIQGMFTNWIRFVGPMRALTSDQETSIMKPHTNTEIEHLDVWASLGIQKTPQVKQQVLSIQALASSRDMSASPSSPCKRSRLRSNDKDSHVMINKLQWKH